MNTRAGRILEAALARNQERLDNDLNIITCFNDKDFDEMPFDIVLNSDDVNEKELGKDIALCDQNFQLETSNLIAEFETSDISLLENAVSYYPPTRPPSSNNIETLISNGHFPASSLIDDKFSTSNTNNLAATSIQDDLYNINSLPNGQKSKLKLVEYDTSSEDDHDNKSEENITESLKNKQTLFKRYNSDRSFFSIENCNEDSDFRFSDESSGMNDNEEGLVGNSGIRKKKKLNKKSMQKAENSFGNGRIVNDIPCKVRCQNRCAQKFTNSERHDIHEFYWGLGNYERQHNWLLTCTEKIPIRRRVQTASVSRRRNTYKYFIDWNDRRVEVCQQYLLKTLHISQMTLRYTVSKSVQKSAKPDERGKHAPHNKTPKNVKEEVHNFIKKLPAVPSHYCRNKSTRKYLPNELKNVSFLYRIFLKHQEEILSCARPSLKIFKEIFLKDFNLGFHQPKKDKCRICECRKDIDFQETQGSKDALVKHLQMKEQSKELFLADQKKYLTDDSYICASFDLQKVLNTPHGDNMLLYYSRKYAVFNETVYESGTRNGICFLWGESDGNRGSNEICSIIFKYLESLDGKTTLKHVSLYCDSCSGQNRNRAMLAMLQQFVHVYAKNLESIKIVFLLPGHTYMPVDSVHATIERFVRKRIVWAPSEWDTIVSNARISPKAFDVVRMQHTEFKNWKKFGDESFSFNVKTSDGQVFKISQVKQAIFQKGKSNFEVNYKYDTSSGMEVLMGQKKGRRNQFAVMSEVLYPGKLPISALKKTNLDKLCTQNVIPKRYHQEFFDLRSKASVRDTLPETDCEDLTDEENP
ncbi:hypothetical protein RI129_010541 [Pyrocoelia pectoralis]|uniref:DUF7869 domain-containing protein n=1 Tax=Pyrocoelia pectoralis TaxID=417401 RepID=A0AAN7UYT3_9COLE